MLESSHSHKKNLGIDLKVGLILLKVIILLDPYVPEVLVPGRFQVVRKIKIIIMNYLLLIILHIVLYNLICSVTKYIDLHCYIEQTIYSQQSFWQN